MNKILYLLLIMVFFSGCQYNSLKEQLVQIDSIASREEDQKAMELLDEIAPESIDDEECLAYYWFLRIRTEIRLDKGIQSVEPSKLCINYFKKAKDKIKLAKAYTDEAYIYIHLGDDKNAILALKEAESIVKDNHKELELANHIYHNLAVINYKAKEKELFLKYSKLALKTAYQINQKHEIVASLMEMYVAYTELNQPDSAYYYLERCIPLIEDVPMNERVSFYNNIGTSYIDKDVNKAQEYFNKALAIHPTAYTYRGLARTYYLKGERERAKELWQQALQTDNLYLKAEILQALYESQRDEGDYKTASETAMQLATLKDSIAIRQREEDIRGQQEQFEQEIDAEIERHRLIMYLALVGMLLCGATALVAYLQLRRLNAQEELRKANELLAEYHQQLEKLQQEGKGDSKQVERLTRKISELQQRRNAQLENGQQRYEEAMGGGTTVRWSRNDFMDCIEYYRTQDEAYIVHLETDYHHLSSKYMFFALMEHLGKTDEELQHLMAISQNTVRSIRSRINKEKKNTI